MIEKETKKEILKFATKQTLKLHQNHTIEEFNQRFEIDF